MSNTIEQTTPETLEPILTHRHRLGETVVSTYYVACIHNQNDTFDICIGSSIHPKMEKITADKFWGFADEFSEDCRCGAIYAVFSKGDVVIVHVLAFSSDGRCVNHRVFTSDDNDQGTDFVSCGLYIIPKASSLEGKGKDHRCLELRISSDNDNSIDAINFFNFPEQPVYGVQQTYTLEHDRVVLTLASETLGDYTWLTVAKEGGDPKRFFSLHGGIEFLGYKIHGGSYSALFKLPDGFGFTASPLTYELVMLLSDTPPERLGDHTCTVNVGENLYTNKIWLDEKGQLYGRYSSASLDDGLSSSIFWMCDRNTCEWVICETETGK